MSIDPDTMRMALRRWASGVTIVTAKYGEIQHGMTVSSFTSLSLDPPSIMVALEHKTRTLGLVEQSGAFGVSVLSVEQEEISNRFAMQKTEAEFRFHGVETITLKSDVPLISGGLLVMDCTCVDSLKVGTHTVFIGEVTALQLGEKIKPLLYFNQGYQQLQG